MEIIINEVKDNPWVEIKILKWSRRCEGGISNQWDFKKRKGKLFFPDFPDPPHQTPVREARN